MADELDYLFLAAHPDDAELMCGGTIIKLGQQGYRVGILDFTRGEAATTGSVAEREHETAAADAILKPAWRHNLGLPDGGLQDCLEHRKPLVDAIREQRPKLIVAPWAPCRHPDHTAVHHLARSTWFFSGNGGFPSALPPYRPRRVIYHLEHKDVRPSFVVDITDQFEAKQQAVAAYGSQFYSGKTYIGSSEFHAMMIARMQYFGGLIGTKYGEPYIVEEMLRIDDPLANALHG